MTNMKASTNQHLEISFVMPAYNAAQWIEPTVRKLQAAIAKANVSRVEIIIIDDGSSDKTKRVSEQLAAKSSEHIMVLSHKNSGRFLTRKRGVEAAKYDTIFFVDTRVWIDEGSLKFVLDQLADHPDRLVWNGHVNVVKKGNIIARFMDSLTLIGWRRYFSAPKLTSYGIDDFDYYPKGTGMFLAPKSTLIEAMSWFESVTNDVRNSSDDTLLIRHIAEQNRIWLSPDFSCSYFARTTLPAFAKHSYHRGQFFVDGFLRRGTRFFYPLIAFFAVSFSMLVACILWPRLLIDILIPMGLVVWLIELLIALLLGLNARDALSLFLLSPIFLVTYSAGIWTAFIKRSIR